MRGRHFKTLIQLVLVLLVAAALKYHYSNAGVDDLRWVLAPTSLAVEVVTGESFRYEAHSGYLIEDRSFLIAKSCSGVNFLIVAFLTLSLTALWKNRVPGTGWMTLAFAAAASYAATIAANTVRIAVAVRSIGAGEQWGFLDGGQVHRIEGIAIYFGSLLLLFIAVSGWRSVSANPLRLLLPLVIYYGATISVPILNGAYARSDEFWEHTIFVLITPLAITLPAFLFNRFTSSGTTRHQRMPAGPELTAGTL